MFVSLFISYYAVTHCSEKEARNPKHLDEDQTTCNVCKSMATQVKSSTNYEQVSTNFSFTECQDNMLSIGFDLAPGAFITNTALAQTSIMSLNHVFSRLTTFPPSILISPPVKQPLVNLFYNYIQYLILSKISFKESRLQDAIVAFFSNEFLSRQAAAIAYDISAATSIQRNREKSRPCREDITPTKNISNHEEFLLCQIVN